MLSLTSCGTTHVDFTINWDVIMPYVWGFLAGVVVMLFLVLCFAIQRLYEKF